MEKIAVNTGKVTKKSYVCKCCGVKVKARSVPKYCQLCFYENPDHETPDEFRLAEPEEESLFDEEYSVDSTFKSIEKIYGVDITKKLRCIYNAIDNNRTEDVNDVFISAWHFLNQCDRQARLSRYLQNINTFNSIAQAHCIKKAGKDMELFNKRGYVSLRLEELDYLSRFINMDYIQDLP